MSEEHRNEAPPPENDSQRQDAFSQLGQDGRVARNSRMIAEAEPINAARKRDIRDRVNEYLKKHGIHQSQLARECQASKSVVSEVLRGVYGRGRVGGKCDDAEYLRRFNNWMERHARQQNVIQNREFVETSVAREIVTAAEVVSETLCMALVFGPARIGKSFTLRALAGSDRLGHPVLIRVSQSTRMPTPLCRSICDQFELPVSGTFERLMIRLVRHLEGTKRMLMIDEADRCPVLLAGKPTIYGKLGFRDMGDFREVTDQLAGRIVICRDLTERTRRPSDPEPLFSLADIRKLIQVANLDLKVNKDAQRWLQDRACTLGLGGIGKTVIHIYLAYKYAKSIGADEITAEHLETIEQMTIGHEDFDRVEDVVNESTGKRIRRLG